MPNSAQEQVVSSLDSRRRTHRILGVPLPNRLRSLGTFSHAHILFRVLCTPTWFSQELGSSIFKSRLGSSFHIGREIFPTPQIMGALCSMHSFHLSWLSQRLGGGQISTPLRRIWSAGEDDDKFSIEIKTSSHPNQIFGNRSYGVDNPSSGKKAKDGYYLAVNFEKWSDVRGRRPEIRLIRFGWLDHTDWIAQERGNWSAVIDSKRHRQQPAPRDL